MTANPAVEVGPSGSGRGVFARATIAAGRRVMEMTGARVALADVAVVAAAGGHDGFLQIGTGTCIGLSGNADDYVNHSCEPNCYIEIAGRRAYLKARRVIEAGEELCFDYGATQIAFPFRFGCACGSVSCRGEIGNYDEIPLEILDRYRREGVLVPYIERLVEEETLPLAGR